MADEQIVHTTQRTRAVRHRRRTGRKPRLSDRQIRRRAKDDLPEDPLMAAGREAATLHASGLTYQQIAERQGLRSANTARDRAYRWLEYASRLHTVEATRHLLGIRADRHYQLLLVQLHRLERLRSPYVPGHLRGDQLLEFLDNMPQETTRLHNNWIVAHARNMSSMVRRLGEELERHARIAGVLQAVVNVGPNAGATIGQQILVPDDPDQRERLAQLCREADGILGSVGAGESGAFR